MNAFSLPNCRNQGGANATLEMFGLNVLITPCDNDNFYSFMKILCDIADDWTFAYPKMKWKKKNENNTKLAMHLKYANGSYIHIIFTWINLLKQNECWLRENTLLHFISITEHIKCYIYLFFHLKKNFGLLFFVLLLLIFCCFSTLFLFISFSFLYFSKMIIETSQKKKKKLTEIFIYFYVLNYIRDQKNLIVVDGNFSFIYPNSYKTANNNNNSNMVKLYKFICCWNHSDFRHVLLFTRILLLFSFLCSFFRGMKSSLKQPNTARTFHLFIYFLIFFYMCATCIGTLRRMKTWSTMRKVKLRRKNVKKYAVIKWNKQGKEWDDRKKKRRKNVFKQLQVRNSLHNRVKFEWAVFLYLIYFGSSSILIL